MTRIHLANATTGSRSTVTVQASRSAILSRLRSVLEPTPSEPFEDSTGAYATANGRGIVLTVYGFDPEVVLAETSRILARVREGGAS